MTNVVSATTKFSGRPSKREEFLSKAAVLLVEARAQQAAGRYDVALETAYRAALRTAGARIAASKVAKRVRKPQGAWEQLKLVDESGKQWAEVFEAFSRKRARVASGLDFNVEPLIVARLVAHVEEFLAEAEIEAGWLPNAA